MATRPMQTRHVRETSTKSSPAQHWGLLVMTAVAVVTMGFSIIPTSRRVASPSPVGHQTIFGKSGRGGISIEGQPRKRGRVLEEEVVSKPLVDYETQLELFICAVEGNDAYVVGEEQMAAALTRVSGLGQVRERERQRESTFSKKNMSTTTDSSINSGSSSTQYDSIIQ